MSDDPNIKNDVDALNSLLFSSTSAPLSTFDETNQTTSTYESIDKNAIMFDLNNRRDYYLYWYLAFGLIQAILVSLFSITLSGMAANSSRNIYGQMFGI